MVSRGFSDALRIEPAHHHAPVLPSRARVRQFAVNADSIRSLLGQRAVLPGDDRYDELRRVWNGIHDRRPTLIARCVDAAEVGSVLKLATAAGLPVTVRGGGHNVAGSAVADDAIMIDLSLMREVTVDPRAQLATAQGGCLLRDLDAATTPYGLACPAGVVSHTGLGGLALGGGYGWLARKWGLTCDHIVAAEVVLADGSVVEASESARPELLWAMRGGGGNFGIVTRFTLRLRAVGPVCHRTGVYPMNRAGEALAIYREIAEQQSADQHAVGALKIAGAADWIPEGLRGKPALFLTATWLGDQGAGPAAIAPLFDRSAPDATLDRVLSFTELQALGDHSEPHGNRYFTKSCYLGELPDGPIEQMLLSTQEIGSPRSCVDFEYLGGAIGGVPDEDSAFPRRDAPYIYTASAQWIDPDEDEEHVAWSRRSVARLSGWQFGGAYSNYVQDDLPGSAANLFGERRYERLAAVKRQFDPDNLFRHNQNVPPSVVN